jgi:hypothetical protein
MESCQMVGLVAVKVLNMRVLLSHFQLVMAVGEHAVLDCYVTISKRPF